jgi:hypothetical protein
VILVVVAFAVGFMLLWKGGGGDVEGVADDDLPGTTLPADGGQTTDSTDEAPPATAVPPAQLGVLVANGSSIRGLAGQTADQLKAAGYTQAAATDATQNVSSTLVYFVEGFEADAQVVSTTIGLPAERGVQAMPGAPPVASLGEAKVLVVLGPDAPSAGGATTTTAP